MRRRVLIALCCVAVVAAGTLAAVLAIAADDKPPTQAELYRLQDRIGKRWDSGEFARQGIYITETGHPSEPCVEIALANPTQPNIEHLRRELGPDVCVDREPAGGFMQACPGRMPEPLSRGSVTVPDLRGLGLYEAERRVMTSGLTFSIACLGDHVKRPTRPERQSPLQPVRITTQCPRAGERVPPGTEVALEGVGILPGGFELKVGSLNQYNTGTSTSCSDGRNADR